MTAARSERVFITGASSGIGAVHSDAEALRLEMQPHGIRVVTIAPGYIDTPMTRNKRYTMPFLMSPERCAGAAVRAPQKARKVAP